MTGATEPLIEVVDLRIRAGTAPILNGVTFTVAAGESVSLVGVSGSGKTTTALAVLGHLRAGSEFVGGSVRVAGRDVLPGGIRQGLAGYLGQDPSVALNPHRRVSTTLRSVMGRSTGARRGTAVADLLDRVGLDPGLSERYPHQLSGGQQQRVALALALARNPRLLVLDEPTSALDVVSAAEVRRELLALRDSGVSLLWITHDLGSVAGAAVDRVLVVDDGRIVESAPHTQLMRNPRSEAAAALVAAVRPLPAVAGPATEQEPRLLVENLVAGHRHRGTVLDGVSFDLFAGRCTAVLGVSGAGKTTLARCLAGLHVPTAGAVHLGGRPLAADVRRRTPADRAAIQYIAQDPVGALHPTQNVRKALIRPLRVLRGMRDRRGLDAQALRLLAMVGLPGDYLSRLPSELSGGERQRVALARALAADPDVLVCDEITAALDVVTQNGIIELLAELRRDSGLCLVFITHNPDLARRMADDVLYLADGRLGPAPEGLLDLDPGLGAAPDDTAALKA
ncbi:ATP-binding cassette domain-containing protein [Nocardia sp. NPDC050710]|uniref:ABC transporter ATP-binding protein n=1 Tax=Nocardia sp. NPDC050710 TaxID=3157220 RepID=UPI0033F0003B